MRDAKKDLETALKLEQRHALVLKVLLIELVHFILVGAANTWAIQQCWDLEQVCEDTVRQR